MSAPVPAVFVAGAQGRWRIDRLAPFRGEPLPPAARLDVQEGVWTPSTEPAAWQLRGVTGHKRYVTRSEHEALTAAHADLERPAAVCAALIPIRKSAAWWDLPQDERRAILEDRSHHTALGLQYMPAIARRLYQSRELGEEFDFLTWFEFAPGDALAFEDLVGKLRATEEWRYVEREVDVRLSRA